MPALNFSACFIEKVQSGKKRQTIRKRRKHPIKEGDRLYLYTGLRTKRARKLREEICIDVSALRIESEKEIFLNGKRLDQEAVKDLAVKDGFLNAAGFVKWFEYRYGLPFEGDVIRW